MSPMWPNPARQTENPLDQNYGSVLYPKLITLQAVHICLAETEFVGVVRTKQHDCGENKDTHTHR